MSRFSKWVSGKSMSRELATILLLFTCYLGLDGDAEMAGIFIGPSILFAMGAFGLDAAAKKFNLNDRPTNVINTSTTSINTDPNRMEP